MQPQSQSGASSTTSSPIRLAAPGQTQTFEPGGVGRRFVAMFIDGVISNIILFPLMTVITVMLMPMMRSQDSGEKMMGVLIQYAFQFVFWVAFTAAYSGWFYRNKGATPGKLLLGLRVVDAQTGTYLGLRQTLIREVLGRIADTLTLGIGLLMAAFREDKRALHDLIAGTQVLRVRR
ncbi:MAG TPA: RDD family protein [Bdellovibrionota bacterium]|nr:RDD family protein [Bdellovibrionota bacterium]